MPSLYLHKANSNYGTAISHQRIIAAHGLGVHQVGFPGISISCPPIKLGRVNEGLKKCGEAKPFPFRKASRSDHISQCRLSTDAVCTAMQLLLAAYLARYTVTEVRVNQWMRSMLPPHGITPTPGCIYFERYVLPFCCHYDIFSWCLCADFF